MKTKKIFLLLMAFISVSAIGQSALDSWESLISSPARTNGVVLLPKVADLKYWNIQIFKREYSGGTYSDVPITKEIFTGVNSYYIPNAYQIDTYSYEYMYQVVGINSANQVVFDSGRNSVSGDGTPKVLQRSWVCNGYDYAYRINLYTLSGLVDGTLQVEGPGYVYEYIRPFDLPCFIEEFPDYLYFNEVHGLTPGWCSNLEENDFNFSVLSLINDNESYYDKYGFQITTPQLYAVQKVNWMWPSGSIIVDNISDASDLVLADFEFIMNYINLYSNISVVSPDYPELDCFYYGSEVDEDYAGANPGSIADCIMAGTADAVLLDQGLGGNSDVVDLADIISNCQESGGVSFLSDVTVVDISDLKKPITIVSYDRDDMTDENGNFDFPPFALEKGTYWVSFSFMDGTNSHVFKTVNNRLINSVEDNLLVNFTIFPVPIVGNEFSVGINSATTTSCMYEVLDHAGKVVYSTRIKVNINDDFVVKVKIEGNLSSGNVFHRFTFADGSVETINTIKN